MPDDDDIYDGPYSWVDNDPENMVLTPREAKRIRRTVTPERWNRSTRWQAGMSRIPRLPDEGVTGHVRLIHSVNYARTLTSGWEFCKRYKKQPPQWYVHTAVWLMAEHVREHIGRCGVCQDPEAWKWFFDKTDRTPLPTLPSEGELS